jgi:hypothetical protein
LALSISELNLGLTALQEHYTEDTLTDTCFKSTVIRDLYLNGLPCVAKESHAVAGRRRYEIYTCWLNLSFAMEYPL